MALSMIEAAKSVTAAVAVSDIDVGEEGVFSGYASLFGVTDLSGDQLQAGAFQRSIERRGVDGIKLLYQHDPAEPLGRWLQIAEDAKGLRVTGQLQTGVARAREVLVLMKAGILDGLSIGFRTIRARQDAKSGIRRVGEVDLWEISIVTFPMLPGARITSVGPEQKTAELAARLSRNARLMRIQSSGR